MIDTIRCLSELNKFNHVEINNCEADLLEIIANWRWSGRTWFM